jgi:hypothetical protein
VPYIDPSRGIYRRDALHVLTRATMPAVLLEGGTIVNREEELDVSTPAYRSKIGASVTTAIRRFCGFAASAATDRVIGAAGGDALTMHSGPDQPSSELFRQTGRGDQIGADDKKR